MLSAFFGPQGSEGVVLFLLGQWYIGFNPLLDTPCNNLVWVKLPVLLLEFWMRWDFEEISNFCWYFVYLEPCCFGAQDKRLAWILVEINLAGGILENINLERGPIKLIQCVDYWVIPFYCLIFHNMGHLLNRCPRGMTAHSCGMRRLGGRSRNFLGIILNKVLTLCMIILLYLILYFLPILHPHPLPPL
jgi:hypothetical protein